MALLGGVGGNPDFALTPARVAALREIEGTMRIEVTGAQPWGVVLHFGAPPIPEVTTTVSIADAEFAQLLSGALDLQGAFMTGKLQLGGNVEVPMKMAMAIMTPGVGLGARPARAELRQARAARARAARRSRA